MLPASSVKQETNNQQPFVLESLRMKPKVLHQDEKVKKNWVRHGHLGGVCPGVFEE